MYELRVLSGMHRGAALPLFGEQWSIGADADLDDLALFDPGIVASHCNLQRSDDQWTLDAQGGAFTDVEGQAFTHNTLQLDQPFALGHVWLTLVPADSPWPPVPAVIPDEPPVTEEQPAAEAAPLPEPPPSRPSYAKRIMIAGMVITVASSAWAFSRPEPAVVAVASAIAVGAAAMPMQPKNVAAEKQIARQKLQKMLNDRMLEDSVSIEETATGFTLKGGLKGESLSLYQRMIERFRQQLDPSISLVDNVNAIETKLPFAIVQVLTGEQAHIVTADGRRMFVGDEVNGLRLMSIDDKQIEFGGNQHYVVKW